MKVDNDIIRFIGVQVILKSFFQSIVSREQKYCVLVIRCDKPFEWIAKRVAYKERCLAIMITVIQNFGAAWTIVSVVAVVAVRFKCIVAR